MDLNRYLRLPPAAALVLVLASLQGWMLAPATLAQSAAAETVDRPTQRWLPLPHVDASDKQQQTQLLKFLSRQVLSGAADDSPSASGGLSSEQLQSMQDAFTRQMEPESKPSLPFDLDQLPLEWLNRVSSDPQLRQQAQQLLEQYARQRRLPSPGAAESSQGSGVPLPPSFAPGNDDANNRNARQPLGRGRVPDTGSQRQQPPANPRTPRPLDSWNSLDAGNSSGLSDDSPALPALDQQFEDQQFETEPRFGQVNDGGIRAPAAGDDQGGWQQDLEISRDWLDNAVPRESRGGPLGVTGARSAGGEGSAAASNGRAAAGTNVGPSDEASLDVKSLVERHGLGETLRQIVQKTLKDQADDEPGLGQEIEAWLPGFQSGGSRSQRVTKSTTAASRPQPSDTRPGPGGNSKPASKSNGQSGMQEVLSDFWKSIQSAPQAGGSAAAAPPAGSSATASSRPNGLQFQFNGRAWLLLAIVVVLATFSWWFRSRLVPSISLPGNHEAACAKEILRDGIRSRADVIRAFHRFVLATARPVALWWPHRYAANRLAETAPHLRNVIDELTGVYEQARYLPPEVELSREQIRRVENALRQCEAGAS